MVIGVEKDLGTARAKMAKLREYVSTYEEDDPARKEATDLLDLLESLIHLADTQAKNISLLQMQVSQARAEARRRR